MSPRFRGDDEYALAFPLMVKMFSWHPTPVAYASQLPDQAS